MDIQEQFKISIFSSAFKFLLKPLISAVKNEFKEHALEWLIEIVKDAFDKSEDESTVLEGPPKGGCPRGYIWNGTSCVPDVG